jgi:proteasome beta subunit
MMEKIPDDLKKGTTTVGIVCKDGVVMGTEHRATMGTLIAHKGTKKLFKIDDNIALTVAGLVGDAQVLARYLSAEVELYKLKRGMQMSIRASSTLMSNILNGSKYYPYWVQLLVGGVDEEGMHVYSIDAAGGSISDVYCTTGSGSPYVYGVLEDNFEEGLSTSEGVDLAIRGITAAMKRDSASGNGLDIAVLTKDGYKEIPEDEIKKRMAKMKLSPP